MARKESLDYTRKSISQENPQDDLQKSYPGVNYFKIIPVSSIIASKKGSPMKSENDTQNDEDFDMLELHEQDDKNNFDNEDMLQETEDMVIFWWNFFQIGTICILNNLNIQT